MINYKILKVSLSDSKVDVETKDDAFYRKYLGGSALGLYYCLNEIPANCSPLDPENVICFSTSIITGVNLPCLSRFSVNAKSPITNGIADSQCGGYWGPELKYAGFDALVISGKSNKPVYIYITNNNVEIIDAEGIWGRTTGETEEAIRKNHNDKNIRIASIGKAGENKVIYSNIISDCSHASGRTGLGAVMGSKNLKAIAVRGNRDRLYVYDKEGCKIIAKKAAEKIKTNPTVRALNELGTSMLVKPLQKIGGLPTKNFNAGIFEGFSEICGESMHEKLSVKSDTCYACSIRCKREVSYSKEIEIDPLYGGPEYETIAGFGSNLMVDNIKIIAKANELCNKYGLDTISTSSSIAFAMECNEKGLLENNTIDGEKIEFGNEKVIIPLIERIADRIGIGDLLAEGPEGASNKIGKGSEKYAMHVKGNPLPFHMPRVKRSLALIYSVNPFGADHMSSVHDAAISETASAEVKERMRFLGIPENSEPMHLDSVKIRFAFYTQMYYSLLDSLCLCVFGFSPAFLFGFKDIIEIIRCSVGWEVSSWELMKVGERRINMMRKFNEICGYDARNDRLPSRMFEKLTEGPSQGAYVDLKDYEAAKREYYELAGWDIETGNPKDSKIKELGLNWILQEKLQ